MRSCVTSCLVKAIRNFCIIAHIDHGGTGQHCTIHKSYFLWMYLHVFSTLMRTLMCLPRFLYFCRLLLNYSHHYFPVFFLISGKSTLAERLMELMGCMYGVVCMGWVCVGVKLSLSGCVYVIVYRSSDKFDRMEVIDIFLSLIHISEPTRPY